MANKTNKDGWEDGIPEFDSEEEQRKRDQEERAIEAEIKRKENL
ncbi:hypothetical protein [Yersinia rohdei]|nr:hypothetical protein [Yersinia rohdei]